MISKVNEIFEWVEHYNWCIDNVIREGSIDPKAGWRSLKHKRPRSVLRINSFDYTVWLLTLDQTDRLKVCEQLDHKYEEVSKILNSAHSRHLEHGKNKDLYNIFKSISSCVLKARSSIHSFKRTYVADLGENKRESPLKHPFKSKDIYQLFEYLRTNSNKQDLILYSYIFNFLTDNRIDAGLPPADYFDFVRRECRDDVKDRKPQGNANNHRRIELLSNLYEEFKRIKLG